MLPRLKMGMSSSPSCRMAAAEIVAAMGEHIYTVPGECMRRHGDLILVATGISGEHTLNLQPGFCAARELVSGRRYEGVKIVFRADGPSVFLFKMSPK